MAALPATPTVATATFKVLEGAGADGKSFPVQFNPVSLEYTISTEFDDRNGSNGARQFVKKSSAKLTMTLVFDTTDDGSDVRKKTEQISSLLEPAEDGSKKFAPKVEFGWGTYRFKGVVEQYKETIDFFSADGVPLRASINLTLASQEVELAPSLRHLEIYTRRGLLTILWHGDPGTAEVLKEMADQRLTYIQRLPTRRGTTPLRLAPEYEE